MGTSRRSAGLTAMQERVLGLMAAAEKPLQTADIRKQGRLSTIEARDACQSLLECGLVLRRIRVVPVTVGTRMIRQRRAFWTVVEKGRELLARKSTAAAG